jgi:UDP-3-O-[3-hydroxymyristoyl] glucosamine N-acyltransferase
MNFKSKKIKLSCIIKFLNLKLNLKKNLLIKNIANIDSATKGDITLCLTSKYLTLLDKTEASACIITKNFLKRVPTNCIPLVSENPHIDFIKVSNLFYGDFVIDKISKTYLKSNQIKSKFKKISFGNNFICENGVKIGKNVNIGHNVTIKENCVIFDNVNIGSNVVISNSIIHKNVNICDGSIIGKKGFGFKFFKGELLRIPHVGKVIIHEGVEIGSNCNIDRGSISDTIIGKYTFLDNQIQIAHNVKIGDYCMLASQVGISGSTVIGNYVSIGGQAGISGHLKIGNNVKIGGKTGVIKNIDDNKTVMGYPAMDFRDFIKKNMIK